MHFYCLLRKRNIANVSAGVKFGPIYLALNLLLVPQLTVLLSFSFLFQGSFRIYQRKLSGLRRLHIFP